MKKGPRKTLEDGPIRIEYNAYLALMLKQRKEREKARKACIDACKKQIQKARSVKEVIAAFGLVCFQSWARPDLCQLLEKWAPRCSSVNEAHKLFEATKQWPYENPALKRWDTLSRESVARAHTYEQLAAVFHAAPGDFCVRGARELAWKKILDLCSTLDELRALNKKVGHTFGYNFLSAGLFNIYESLYRQREKELQTTT